MIWGKRALDDLDAEIGEHLEREIEDNLARGMSPEAARNAARRKFGSLTLAKEDARAVWVPVWLDQLRQDLTYTLRGLRRSPGFWAVSALTLALGIGANTAIFSVVNAVLLRQLPYKNSDQLVTIGGVLPQPGLTAAEIQELRSRSQTLTQIGVYFPFARALTWTGSEPVRLTATEVTPSILEMVGTQPLLGRLFDAHEDEPGANRVVILSYPTWQQYFDANPTIVGQQIPLNGNGYSVIGVMPRAFRFPDGQTQVWIPLAWPPAVARLIPTARLKDHVTIEAATAEINTIIRQLRGPVSDPLPLPLRRIPSASAGFTVVRVRDQGVTSVRPALRLLTMTVAFVLLIGCVNVANLLLARATARQGELAVRRALGASRHRLVRQLVTESAVLALIGGVAGTLLAFGAIHVLRTYGASLPRQDVGLGVSIPRFNEIGIDASVLTFTLLITVLAGLTFGLVPAIRQARTSIVEALHVGGSARSGFSLLRQNPVQGLLVVAQVGLATVLLVGGTLLIRSFVNLVRVQPGYNPQHVLTFRVGLPADQYATTLPEDLTEHVRSLPGTHAAGYTRVLPVVFLSSTVVLSTTRPAANQIPPPPPPPGVVRPPEFPDLRIVSRDYVKVMGIPVVAGRGLTEDDGAGRPQVMLINRTLARTGLFGEDPIGKQIYALGTEPWQIVGVVEDTRQFLETSPGPQVFVDERQIPRPRSGGMARGALPYFVLRTSGTATITASAILAAVRQVQPQATLYDVAPMEELVANSVSRQRLYAVLMGLFAAVAVSLSAVGLAGVMGFVVAQRTREIGIRMALGARHGRVMALVFGQSAVLIGVGVSIGLAGSAATTRYLRGLLFGVGTTDPATFIAAAVMFAGVAGLAAYGPARRASRVDPLISLRYE